MINKNGAWLARDAKKSIPRRVIDSPLLVSNSRKANDAKASKNRQKVVRMWNPSDSPTDAEGAIALNYETHGALTKLYLKPTLPFNLTFSA